MTFTLTKTVKTETDQSDWKYEFEHGLTHIEGALTKDGCSYIHEVGISAVDARLSHIIRLLHTEMLRQYHYSKCKRSELSIRLHLLGLYQN